MNDTGETLVVTNTNDSGAGSLRQAIDLANLDPGPDSIAFNIPGPIPHVIAPTSPLPAVTTPIAIDATGQPGYDGLPVVELNGASIAGRLRPADQRQQHDGARPRNHGLPGWTGCSPGAASPASSSTTTRSGPIVTGRRARAT